MLLRFYEFFYFYTLYIYIFIHFIITYNFVLLQFWNFAQLRGKFTAKYLYLDFARLMQNRNVINMSERADSIKCYFNKNVFRRGII